MITVLRIVSLLCGIVFKALGWVWAYWIALIGWLLGGIGWGLLVWADRCEKKTESVRTTGQAQLATSARWLLIVSAAISLVVLVFILIAN